MEIRADIGIIGGSGLYEMDGFEDVREVPATTPFGAPSDHLVVGRLHGQRVAFLARHARGHRILPSELNFRANLYALKNIGVQWVLSVSAVGSLKIDYAPLDIVIPDQFVDRTTQRKATFFGNGLVAHVAFAHPFCANLSNVLADACRENGVRVHVGGAYVCIEGPQFSTRAESELYRSWGMDIVGMTNLQEARLAREAEICYATLAMVTDYDCWHPQHDSVTAEQIIANLGKNAATAKAVLASALRRLPIRRDCECADALKYALVTAPELVPEETRRDLAPIIGRYIKESDGERGALATTVDHFLGEWGSGEWTHAFHRLIELGPQVVPHLAARFKRSDDAALRAELVEIAHQQFAPEALPFLAQALRDPDDRVWKAALDGLVGLASEGSLEVLEESLRAIRPTDPQLAEYRAWVQEALDQTRAARHGGGSE